MNPIDPIVISVIVPTIGRDSLRATLRSLLDQTLDSSSYEIIIVSDRLDIELSWLPTHVKVIWSGNNLGPSAARNRGAEVAVAELLAFTDDDCVVPRDWLSELLTAFANFPQTSIVGGYLRPSDFKLATTLLARYEFQTMAQHGLADAPFVALSGTSIVFGTNNLAWRKNEFHKLAGFDESLRVGEDSDLAIRAGTAGLQALFVPLAVIHNREYSWRSFWFQHFSRGSDFSHQHSEYSTILILGRLGINLLRSIATLHEFDLGRPIASAIAAVAFTFGQFRTARARH